uniref:G-rich RNA sequence binding factor 1 n=1 Tax=Neogobius melanostomus TaxID=47308 RepID=A0A8C6UNZ4_9GOBI
MSGPSKALLCLLQRSVRVAQITLPRVNNSNVLSGSRSFFHHRSVSSAVRGVGLKSDFETQSVLRTSYLNFCTKSPVEDEYPPLPEYQSDSDLQKKDVYIIQVKGLPWSCTPQDLLQFFSECRICDGLEGIHLTTDRLTGKPSGQAFIEVEHEDDVSKALQKHRQYLGPRYVEVCEVTNSDAESILKKAVDDASSDLVVRLRGLPYSSSEADILQFFSGLDIVQNGITIVTDHQGRNSGKAYVEFTSQQAFEEALRKDRELIGNRYIEVFPSKKDDVHTSWRSRTNSSLLQQKSTPRTESIQHNRNRSQLSSAPLSHYVHLRGLPFNASGEDIVKFFSPLVVTKVLIEFGPDGRQSGDADVYFSCHQEAVTAMSRDRMHIGERYIELFLNSDPDSDRT